MFSTEPSKEDRLGENLARGGREFHRRMVSGKKENLWLLTEDSGTKRFRLFDLVLEVRKARSLTGICIWPLRDLYRRRSLVLALRSLKGGHPSEVMFFCVFPSVRA